MGSVWRAEHVELGTPAAVKLIDRRLAQSRDALARFKREAQAAAALRSTNVVQILDYGVDGGEPYIAMELLEGENLGARLARFGRIEPSHLGWVLSQVGKAVSRAHELGIVHRDLKPENIYLARDGNDEVVKVLDFGIAKAQNAMQLTGAPKTRTGVMLGTPYYMSPEQSSGQRTVDHRTDIWALGVIAFECLTGRRPFVGDSLVGLALAICQEPMPVPSQRGAVPAGFDEWFARAAHRDPECRYPSVPGAIAELCVVCGLGQGRSAHSSIPPALAGASPPAQAWQPTPFPSGAPAAGAAATGAQPTSQTARQLTGSPSSVTVRGAPTSSRLPIALGALGVLAMVGMGVVGAVLVFGGEAKTEATSATDSETPLPSALPTEPGMPGAAQALEPAVSASSVAHPEASAADTEQEQPPDPRQAAAGTKRSGPGLPEPAREAGTAPAGAAEPAPAQGAAPAKSPAPSPHGHDGIEERLAF